MSDIAINCCVYIASPASWKTVDVTGCSAYDIMKVLIGAVKKCVYFGGGHVEIPINLDTGIE